MTISKAKRKFIAENLARSAEYVLSIVILGHLISGRINVSVLIGGGVTYLVFLNRFSNGLSER